MRRPTCWLCEDGTILEVGNRRAKAYEKHLFYNQINAAPTANVQRGVGSVDAVLSLLTWHHVVCGSTL